MEDERTYTVYCHTNKTNGKKYVGITIQTLNQRWRQGKGYGKTSPIYKAIKHYGWDGFDHDVLLDGLSYDEACEAEKSFIKELNSLVPNGYNLELGGNSKKQCSEETKRKMSEARKGVKQNISEEERKRRSERMKRLNPMGNPVFVERMKESRRKLNYSHSAETRQKISEKCIERFKTPEWKERLRIQNAGERNPMYGKHCSEENKKLLREVHLGKKHSEESKRKMSENHADFSGGNSYGARPVRQYTLDGEFVAEYDSISTAKKAIPHGDIAAALHGRAKTAGGYRWEYSEVKQQNINNDNWRRNIRPKWKRDIKVVQFDLDGNEIKEFDRLQDAAEAVNSCKSNISRCCLGKTEAVNGYVFQYR